MKNLKEEIHYCTTCGAVNKKSAVYCGECKKKIIVRHRPVADFLKRRIKGKAAGEATKGLFDIIKDFLFDLLYGTILTVSVVATVTTAVVTATPFIENVKTHPSERAEEVSADGVFEPTERDIMWYTHIICTYDAEIDNSKRSGDPYWTDDDEYSSATEFWAENNIEGYVYNGVHELYNNPLPMGQDEDYDIDENRAWHGRYVPEVGARTGSNVKSELGHALLADGYDVLEADFYCLTYDMNEVSWDTADFDVCALPPDGAYEKYVYTFLLTRKHGEDRWYIAEERLTERYGGPRYAV